MKHPKPWNFTPKEEHFAAFSVKGNKIFNWSVKIYEMPSRILDYESEPVPDDGILQRPTAIEQTQYLKPENTSGKKEAIAAEAKIIRCISSSLDCLISSTATLDILNCIPIKKSNNANKKRRLVLICVYNKLKTLPILSLQILREPMSFLHCLIKSLNKVL